jgi:putative membrane protein
MKVLRVFSALLLAAILAAPATAQDGKLSAAQDKRFAKEAAVGGLMEVKLGQAAQEKAQSQDVKDFGKMMVEDHGKANDELKALAQQKNVKLPAGMDSAHRSMVSRLSKKSGADFDKAYMQEMVKDHAADVAEFRKASQEVKDPDLKGWADKTLPALEKHLQAAKDTAQKVGVDVDKAEKAGQAKAAAKEKKKK